MRREAGKLRMGLHRRRYPAYSKGRGLLLYTPRNNSSNEMFLAKILTSIRSLYYGQRHSKKVNQDWGLLTAKSHFPLLSRNKFVDIIRKVAAVFLQSVHSVTCKTKPLCTLLYLALKASPVSFISSTRRLAGYLPLFPGSFPSFLFFKSHLFYHALWRRSVGSSDYDQLLDDVPYCKHRREVGS